MWGFVSYSHEDIAVCNQLLTHLQPFEQMFGLKFHVDQRNNTGRKFDTQIERWIEEACVHILMISPYSLVSDIIMNCELPAIRAKANDKGDLVLPLVVSNCRYGLVTGTLLASPRNEQLQLKPVTKWSPHSDGLHQASLEFESAIREHHGIAPHTPDPGWGRK